MATTRSPHKDAPAAETVTAEVATRQLGRYIDRVRYKGESFTITKHGTAVAQLVPIATAGAE